MMPPQECKVVRELSPHEKHMIKLFERREKLKAAKEHKLQQHGKSDATGHTSLLEAKKRSQAIVVPKLNEIDQLIYTELDNVVHPEASGGQLDLSRNQFIVNDKFSIQKAKNLMKPATSEVVKTLHMSQS